MMDRRDLFFTTALPLALSPEAFAANAAFPAEPPNRALFPCPRQGATVGVTPPGFAWWRVEGAASYRLSIRNNYGRVVYDANLLEDPVHLPPEPLPAGRYTWNVEAFGKSGERIATRGAWPFTVPEEIPELPWVDPSALLGRVPGAHPRYIFLKEDLPAIRASLRTTRRAAWEEVKARAGSLLDTPLPEPPRYHTFEGRTRQRMGYFEYFRNFRGFLDNAMSVLALAYLMSGDERYGLAAKRILLEVETWGIGGPMSILSPFGDEPGLSLCRHGQRAYDWLYDLFDESERERVRRMTIGRGAQILERLKKADYLFTSAESHNGRLIAYLSEYAIVCKGETSEAATWLDYSLRALTTFYPHWAGPDGGWAEGIGYALAYNTIYLPALESLRAACRYDLYRRPFYGNIRKFFLYCASPIAEVRPFGDGAERDGVGSSGAALLLHHGRRFEDPASVWWSKKTGASPSGSDAMIPLLTEDNVKPAPPSNLPSARLFRGVGWAGLHSTLDQPEHDTFFLFKSSPYGSVSHSHADQNGFAILKGGKALAIPSGHYGPAYGMPHHANWTRQTKANNCILVNGEGQTVRQAWANGAIKDFRHQEAISYLLGDATPAYAGKLTRCHRHVLFLRPGVILMLDDLEAPEPAQFQWLLHSLEKMTLKPSVGQVSSTRGQASLTARLHCRQDLNITQTDKFNPPFNEGNPEEYQREMPNHWHVTASTKTKSESVRILAVMLVRDNIQDIEVKWQSAGLAITTPQGSGQASASLDPEIQLTASWKPAAGPEETFALL